jgi:hypothetical protein
MRKWDAVTVKWCPAAVSLSRYNRGHSPMSNFMLYGYRLTCSCGWTMRVNDTKREARSWAKTHLTGKDHNADGVQA